jgi:hypothetical protein
MPLDLPPYLEGGSVYYRLSRQSVYHFAKGCGSCIPMCTRAVNKTFPKAFLVRCASLRRGFNRNSDVGHQILILRYQPIPQMTGSFYIARNDIYSRYQPIYYFFLAHKFDVGMKKHHIIMYAIVPSASKQATSGMNLDVAYEDCEFLEL